MAKVTLRPIRVTDAELCFRWVSDPDVVRYLGLLQPPTSVEAERAWIAKAVTDKGQQQVFVIEDEKGSAIGTCALRGIDREEGYAFLGMMIGKKTAWNRGYGTAATKALLDLAFGELGLKEVRLSCHVANQRALRCYQKAGFTLGPSRTEPLTYGWAEAQMAIDRARWEMLAGRQDHLSPGARAND